MSLPYVQEMNKWINQSPEPLINQEWDIEYAPEVYSRMMNYIQKQPERIHVAPYLTHIYFKIEGGPVLFWAHRMMREEVKTFHIEEKFTKISKDVRATVRYPAWVAGGEPEADIVCLGFTYIPRDYWNRIYPEIKNLDWRILDVEVSARMLRDGQKALIHWDCIVNHNHVDIRPMERSVFQKWVTQGEKAVLSEDEKIWLGVEKLPRYHGFIGEPIPRVKDPTP
jgi:hypothetical protein